MRRLVIVLADGLRPDAVTPTVMPSLDALGGAYTLARRAHTVRPSATVAALASLATGVGPATHRLIEPGLQFLPRLGSIRPVAWELARVGVRADIVTADLGPAALPVAWTLAATAGVRRLVATGSRARQTAAAAHRLLCRREEGLLFVYLPDCDRAGHAHGWMSERYLEAAAEVDAGIGLLSAWTDDAVFIVTADHGGGGVTPNERPGTRVLRGPAARRSVRRRASPCTGGAGVMRWVTHLGGARVTLGIGFALVALGEPRLGAAVLLANAGSHVFVQALKRAVARARPCDAAGHPLALVELPDPHSFPSGHAAAATAVAVTIALSHPMVAPIVLPLAATVAYSRVALRAHHVSDVLAGVILGAGGAIGTTHLLR